MLEIGKIAEQHDLLVVSDEIYDRLVYDFEHVCFPALDESLKHRTILAVCCAAGLRISEAVRLQLPDIDS